uniref:TrmH family RNA methyltransferase n=1 Tax=Streptococcus equi TaxID=1336 RepID=UPI0039C6EEBA
MAFGSSDRCNWYTSYKWNTSGKLALIIGNEGKGISANIKKQVDEMITIPMMGHVSELKC